MRRGIGKPIRMVIDEKLFFWIFALSKSVKSSKKDLRLKGDRLRRQYGPLEEEAEG